MASPAAVLSILVKTQGAQAAASQLGGIDKSGRAAAGGMSKAESQAKRSGKALSSLGSAAKGAGVLLGAAGLAKGFKTAIDEFQESVKVGAQTEAVLKSTGGAAKVTTKHIQDLAGAISKKSGIDDEAIQSSENMLLTFTKLRNETGKGNKIFDQATQVVTDMSVALGQSGKSSAIQLGKALNDPIKGITALRRVGVSFTEEQQKQITTMVKSGDTLGAQKRILKELKTEFGGSAAAQATAADKFNVALKNVAEAAGAVLVPILNKVMGVLTTFFNQIVQGTGVGGALISKFKELGGVLAPFGQSIAQIVGWLQKNDGVARVLAIGLGILAGAIIAVNVAMSANPFVLAAVAIAALVVGVVTAYREFETFHKVVDAVAGFFIKIWPTVSQAVVTAFAAIKGAVTAAWPTIVSVIKSGVAVVTGVFKAMWPVIKAIFQGGFTALKGVITGAAQILSGAVQVIKGVLTGDFGEIWDGIKGIFRGGFTALKGIITGAAQGIGNAAKTIGSAIIDAIVAAIKAGASKLVDGIKGVVSGAKGAVSGALGAINPFGDGLGFKPITTIPGSGGSLMGASSSLAPFAALGSQYGLHVTSGKRAAGGRTVSGGISYHGSGQAIDLGDGRGPDAAKLAAFRALKSRYGSRLAELIYTPGGVGIKDGKPFRYTGQVAAQHMDHVHVAFTGGARATGGGQSGRNKAFTGDGPGLGGNAKRVWQFLRGHGLTPAQAAGVVGSLQQESGLSTSATNPKSGAYGIGQWLGARKTALMARSNPGSLNTQLQYLWSELQGPESAALQRIKGAHSIADAASAWTWGFERPGKSEANMGARLSNSRAAFNMFQNVTGKGGGGATTATSGAASAAAKVNPFDQKIANADLAIQQVAGNPAAQVRIGSRSVSRGFPQIQAMTAKRKLIGARIRSIRKALKGKVSPAKRLALTTELTQRLQEHAQLGTDIQALRQPPASLAPDTGATGGDAGTFDGGSDPNQALIDSNTALQASIDAQVQAEQDHTDALNSVRDEIKRQTDFATSVQATSNFQLTKSLADLLSGQIVGYGVAGRKFTPGTGVEVAY